MGEIMKLISKFLNLIGIHFPKDQQDRFYIKKKNILIFIGIIIGGIIISSIVFLEYTMKPEFCKSCHIMQPFYDNWKTSTHNKVACVKCHYTPGMKNMIKRKFQALSEIVNFITGKYGTKFHAEIDDASCLREGCHEKRLLKGKVEFKQGIMFDHKPHLTKMRRGKNLRCTTCHSQIVQGDHMVVTEKVCFICHFKGTKHGREENPISGCPSCHSSPKGEIKVGDMVFDHKDYVKRGVKCQKCHLDAIRGDGAVPEIVCLNCHSETEKLEKYKDSEYVHKYHIEKSKTECFHCHTEIKHNIKTDIEHVEGNCSECHTSKHMRVEDMYEGKGGIGVKEMPSAMYQAQVDCSACHIALSGGGDDLGYFIGKTYAASPQACIDCHGEGFDEVLYAWQEDIKNMMLKTKELITQTVEKIKIMNKDSNEYKIVDKLFKDALYNYNFVKYGRGVHNIEYAANLLDASNTNLKKILSRFEVSN